MANVPALTDQEYEAKVAQATRPVVIDFGAEWCGPCKALTPILDEVSQEFAGSVDAYQVDIAVSPEMAARFGIMSVPTLVVVKGGTEVKRSVGLVPKDRLRALFASVSGTE